MDGALSAGLAAAPDRRPAPRSLLARAGAHLDAMLAPASVAIIGASDAAGNRGGTAAALLRRFGYRGEVYPVHPSAEQVAGYPAYTSVAALPRVPDLAIVALRAARTAQTVAELGEAGVGAAIVWAGGFAETGADGAALQRQLTAEAARTGVRLLGPNCIGVVNTDLAFTGTFASWMTRASELLPGVISIVSQSGGLATSAHSWSQDAGVGFRCMISTGNEVDVTAVDALAYLADEPGTAVIAAYLEGVGDGPALLAALARARAQGKSVVVLKGGRSAASQHAVASHTGALAGQARIWDAMLAEAGAIQVSSVEELLEVAQFLAGNTEKCPPAGNRVAVLSYGGGQGVLAADQCAAAGLELPALSEPLRRQLAPLVPVIASTRNPVDLTPEAYNQPRYLASFPEVLRALDESGEIDMFLLQLGAMNRGAEETAMAVIELHRRSRRPVAVQCRLFPASAAALFRAAGVHVFRDQPRASAVLGSVASVMADPGAPDPLVPEAARQLAALPPLRQPQLPHISDGQVLTEDRVHQLLSTAGLPVLGGAVATSANAATEIAARLGPAAVMKVVSTAVTHRARSGLVRIGVPPDQAAQAYRELTRLARAQGITDAGVFVQELHPGDAELFVSAFRDPVFGPMISCGAGGQLAEIIDDLSFARAPVDEQRAVAMLRQLRISRNPAGLDLDRLGGVAAGFLVRLSRLAAALPWRQYVLELNPVALRPESAVPLDALLIISSAAADRTGHGSD